MDDASVYNMGSAVELSGALALWLAVFLRVPTARRSHQQRMLLLAVAGLAGSITVYLDPVTAALNRTFVFAQSCGLFMNVWGVFSSALILDFVLAAMSRRRPWLVYSAMAVTTVALVALNATIAPNSGCVTSEYVPWYSLFWWILVAAHLTGTIPCAVMCVRYSRQAKRDRAFRVGLVLLAGGFISSSVFWTVVLAFLLARPAWLGALFPLNIGVTAWLMTAGTALPLLLAAHRLGRNALALWRLRPLWRELVGAVPHVALDSPRGRFRETLGGPRSVYLRLYREVIEIRDAILILRDHVTPQTVERAREYVRTRDLPENRIEPAVVACWLAEARRAKANGSPPLPNPAASAGFRGHDLRDEIDFLLEVHRARRILPSFPLGSARPEYSTPVPDGYGEEMTQTLQPEPQPQSGIQREP
ncbi:MAB_1171c family putative transporter [Streptomyces sp. RPT161]|uniref:MAB_1171c family putative transporter n=1 Tax=Streptomyces sp. RPT161 TaxID=3015993 RepID=UPI0022B8E5F0|nr:MAB_1171c family putative transporter [Streptomyces sp. RPT161]